MHITNHTIHCVALTAHSTGSVQIRPQPLEQHKRFPLQSLSLLQSISHDPGPVTAGQVRLPVMKSCDLVYDII